MVDRYIRYIDMSTIIAFTAPVFSPQPRGNGRPPLSRLYRPGIRSLDSGLDLSSPTIGHTALLIKEVFNDYWFLSLGRFAFNAVRTIFCLLLLFIIILVGSARVVVLGFEYWIFSANEKKNEKCERMKNRGRVCWLRVQIRLEFFSSRCRHGCAEGSSLSTSGFHMLLKFQVDLHEEYVSSSRFAPRKWVCSCAISCIMDPEVFHPSRRSFAGTKCFHTD